MTCLSCKEVVTPGEKNEVGPELGERSLFGGQDVAVEGKFDSNHRKLRASTWGLWLYKGTDGPANM